MWKDSKANCLNPYNLLLVLNVETMFGITTITTVEYKVPQITGRKQHDKHVSMMYRTYWTRNKELKCYQLSGKRQLIWKGVAMTIRQQKMTEHTSLALARKQNKGNWRTVQLASVDSRETTKNKILCDSIMQIFMIKVFNFDVIKEEWRWIFWRKVVTHSDVLIFEEITHYSKRRSWRKQ